MRKFAVWEGGDDVALEYQVLFFVSLVYSHRWKFRSAIRAILTADHGCSLNDAIKVSTSYVACDIHLVEVKNRRGSYEVVIMDHVRKQIQFG